MLSSANKKSSKVGLPVAENSKLFTGKQHNFESGNHSVAPHLKSAGKLRTGKVADHVFSIS